MLARLGDKPPRPESDGRTASSENLALDVFRCGSIGNDGYRRVFKAQGGRGYHCGWPCPHHGASHTFDFGEPYKAYKDQSFLDGKWYAVQHFSRAGGYWVRENALKAAGVDYKKDFEDWGKAREALLKVAAPEKELWTWGVTINRSGDGETVVKDQVLSRGGQLTDETGQLVVLNKDPYREYAIAGLTFLKEIYGDPMYAKTLSNLKEVEARGGRIIAITDAPTPDLEEIAWEVVTIPRANHMLAPILLSIPLQLLAYYVAVYRGTDVDQPRNLAKSVTVE